MDSTSLFLDDNRLISIGSETFIGRNKLTSLYLNHSQVVRVDNNSFLGLTQLTHLHLDHNQLSKLSGQVFQDLTRLTHLFLDNNRLREIDNQTLRPLVRLEHLTLDNNHLVSLSYLMETVSSSVRILTLRDNPWECQCQILVNIDKQLTVISDMDRVTCDTHTALNSLSSSCKQMDVMAVSAQTNSPLITIISVTIVIVILIIIITSVVIISLRRTISSWIYSRTDDDAVVEYSCYLHYSIKDDEFVKQVFSPKLETLGHRLCLHHRDVSPSHQL